MDFETAVLEGWNALLQVVGFVFNLLFFWLPDDPLAAYIDDLSVQAVNAQAVRWLNWFVDVNLFATVLAVFVTVLLLFAAFKVLAYVVKLVFSAVDAVKPL